MIEGPTIRYDEILRFDIPMKNGSIMASGYGLAHLGKHGGDKAEACV